MSEGTSRARSAHRKSNRPRRRKNGGFSPVKAVLAVVVLCLVIIGAVFLFKKTGSGKPAENEVPEQELAADVTVNGVRISGKGLNEALEDIRKKYDWSMKAVLPGHETQEIEIGDLIEGSIKTRLEEIYSIEEPEESYTVEGTVDEALLDSQIAHMCLVWNKDAKNGSVSGFDKETEQFTYSGEEKGSRIDEEKLRNDILNAVSEKKYDAVIQVFSQVVEPEITEEQAKAMYKTIGAFTTKSTANADRNSNLKLACEAIDGTLLEVGQEFSFNDTTGPRTPEKGYKEAAAYSNGEVVQEPGGGVCQVASTLYNAVIVSGLEASARTGHTYAPTYVTPGEDATVSYGGPDFRFINTTGAALVIRANYADRTVNCSLIGIPILAEGETISLHSEKLSEDAAPPAPVIEDDPTLEAGVQVQVSAGDLGSVWRTYIKHTVNGVVDYDKFFHDTRYKGHTPKYRRNVALWDPSFELMESVEQTNEAGEKILVPGEMITLPSSEGETVPGETVPETPVITVPEEAPVPIDMDLPGIPSGTISSQGPGAH